MKKGFLALLSLSLVLTACDGGQSGTSGKDTVPPTVTLSAKQNATSVNLVATATDSSGISKVEFYRSNSSTPFATDTTAPYTADVTVSSSDNGNQSFTAKAYDGAGNVGSGSTSVNVYVAPPVNQTHTLYQGVWGWGLVDPATKAVIDKGAVIFSDEAENAGLKAALGIYMNEAQTRQGYAILGPITGVGQLETVFSWDSNFTTNKRAYFIASDADGKLGSYEGNATFEGAGMLVDANNQPTKTVGVLLIQVSDTVPSNVTALNRLKAQAKAKAGSLSTTWRPAAAPTTEGFSNASAFLKH